MFGLHDGWLWAIGGLILLIAEVVAPGFFLVFLGVAAVATGLFTLLFDLGIAPQLTLFVIYTALAVMIGKRWYAEPDATEEARSLNDPARRLVGRTAERCCLLRRLLQAVPAGYSYASLFSRWRGNPPRTADTKAVAFNGNDLDSVALGSRSTASSPFAVAETDPPSVIVDRLDDGCCPADQPARRIV